MVSELLNKHNNQLLLIIINDFFSNFKLS